MSRPLPSARLRALGIDVVCRVPGHGHSAKIWHTACPGFTECRPSAKQGTRQSVSFAECWPGGTRQSPRTCPARAPAVRRPSGRQMALSLCRVPPTGTPLRRNFAECAGLALGKVSFAECWSLVTWQNWLKKIFGPSNFFGLYLNLII